MERDEVLPLNGPNQNLDDLANVQGFDSVGRENELYCFKLTQNGMYIREPIDLNTEFCPRAADEDIKKIKMMFTIIMKLI